MTPGHPLDDPEIPPNRWVIWSWNGVCWPRGDREVHFLGERKHVLQGWALFTILWDRAVHFASREEADQFLSEQNMLRPCPYGALNITTVDTLRQRLDFPPRRIPH